MSDAVKLAGRAGQGVKSAWGRLGSSQRIALVGLGTVGVGLLALFLLWAGNPSYAVAYSNLSEENAGAIVAKLKESKIPYRVEAGGTILVPSDQVEDVRLQMAMAKLPQDGGIGYEIFDQTNLGLTDFAQKVNYQRALEGELARTVERIEGVESARVHIVVPEPSLYSEAAKDTTASVVLQLRPGAQVMKAQLEAIAHLVVGSVEGLKLENLTVVDTRGNMLSTAVSPDGTNPTAAQSQVDAQRALEQRLADDIKGLLDKTVGPNKTAVQVRATVDWDKVESSNETYSPDGLPPQVRSQHTLLEGYPNGLGTIGGIPGVGSNVPTYQQGQPSPTPGLTPTASVTPGVATASTGQRQESTVNYELSKRTEKIVKAPGGIKRLSVAVAADSNTLNEAQIGSLRELVASAAGVDQARGDVLTVTAMPFEKAPAPAAAPTPTQQEQAVSLVKTAAPIVGPLLLLLVLWLILRRPSRKAKPVVEDVTQLDEVERYRALGAARPGLPTEETIALAAPQPSEEDERAQTLRQITALAKENPAMLTQLIQTWIEEAK